MNKAKTGRPPLPEAQKLMQYSVRLTADQMQKFKLLGAASWLRSAIDRAKLPNA